MNAEKVQRSAKAIADLSAQRQQLLQETEAGLTTESEGSKEEDNILVQSFYVHGGQNHVTSTILLSMSFTDYGTESP